MHPRSIIKRVSIAKGTNPTCLLLSPSKLSAPNLRATLSLAGVAHIEFQQLVPSPKSVPSRQPNPENALSHSNSCGDRPNTLHRWRSVPVIQIDIHPISRQPVQHARNKRHCLRPTKHRRVRHFSNSRHPGCQFQATSRLSVTHMICRATMLLSL